MIDISTVSNHNVQYPVDTAVLNIHCTSFESTTFLREPIYLSIANHLSHNDAVYNAVSCALTGCNALDINIPRPRLSELRRENQLSSP